MQTFIYCLPKPQIDLFQPRNCFIIWGMNSNLILIRSFAQSDINIYLQPNLSWKRNFEI